MQRSLTILLAAVVVAPALAQPPKTGIESVAEFRPFLSINESPALCDPFLRTWTAVFDKAATLEEENANIATTFPAAKVTRLTEFYETPNRMSVDVGVGKAPKVLYFNPTDVGWRYLGPELFVFESEAAFNEAIAAYGPESRWGLDFRRTDVRPERTPPLRAHHFGSVNSVDIVEMQGKVYLTNNVDLPSETTASQAMLFQVQGDGALSTVCAVDLLPPKQAFAGFRDTSLLFAGLRDVYGEPTYPGTIGWTAEPNDAAFSTMLFRPWAMEVVGRFSSKQYRHDDTILEDASRELRYFNWGASDPQSWKDYLDVKNGRSQFVADMRHHYSLKFAKPGREATAMAEKAWRYLLDQIVYGRNDDRFNLAGFADSPAIPLSIGPRSTPEEVLKFAIDAARRPETRPHFSQEMFLRLLFAAVRLRQDETLIREIAASTRMEPSSAYAPREQESRARMRNEILLAALGHNRLSDLMVEMGADPNAKTGEINKTPLMYAAQQNQLNAVRWLISHRVDVNAQTDNQQYGYGMQRDHRTALMYAAENASAAVIEALLKAGADISAKDTQGNTASWYFGRNTKIVDQQTRASVAALLSLPN